LRIAISDDLEPKQKISCKELKEEYHGPYVCRRYKPFSVVETFGHPRNDRRLFGFIPGHSPDLHQRSAHTRAGRDAKGAVVFTGADIQAGQEVFFKYALMEHGTLWGHGAYLG